ncbi:MAG: hypothetical protein M0Z41_02620 [Peptococcaceae bacterium]|jgi:hypothetical protein|nr:hypothetical protein [Peptococcaceae bacterium]
MKIEIHHLFPQDWCAKNNIEPKLCNSIVNKPPLPAKTNRLIGANAPSVYLERMQKSARISVQRMNELLESYAIEPSTFRVNHFTIFYEARQLALLERIEKVMGKPILRGIAESEISESMDNEEREESAL